MKTVLSELLNSYKFTSSWAVLFYFSPLQQRADGSLIELKCEIKLHVVGIGRKSAHSGN